MGPSLEWFVVLYFVIGLEVLLNQMSCVLCIVAYGQVQVYPIHPWKNAVQGKV